jgi:hypothetical protein
VEAALDALSVDGAFVNGILYASWADRDGVDSWRVVVRDSGRRIRRVVTLPKDSLATQLERLPSSLAPYDVQILGLLGNKNVASGRIRGLALSQGREQVRAQTRPVKARPKRKARAATPDSVPSRARGSLKGAAIEWLINYLADGERPVVALRHDAGEAGFSWAVVRGAAAEIGIQKRRVGFGRGGASLWRLPGDVAPRSQAQPAELPARSPVKAASCVIFACENCGGEVTDGTGATLSLMFADGGEKEARLCGRCAGYLPGRPTLH